MASDLKQSVKITFDTFDTTRLTPSSEIIFEFETQGELDSYPDTSDNFKYPCSLIVQSWEFPGKTIDGLNNVDSEGNVWATVYPAECTETTARFTYDQVVEAYGTDDFNLVDALYCCSTDRCEVLCTKMTVTNVKPKSEGTHKYDSTQKTKTSPVVIAIAVVAAIIIQDVIIILIMNRKARIAYDIKNGSYVDTKK